MATAFMTLDLPTPSVTLGPVWAQELNAAITIIDAHDHTSGKGQRIPTTGLNINEDLDFQTNKAFNLSIVQFDELVASPTGVAFSGSISIFNGDLYYTNLAGIAVQVTAGTALTPIVSTTNLYETRNVITSLVIAPGDTYVYMMVDTSSPRSITLPAASAVTPGRIYFIKDRSGNANTNNITVFTNPGDTLDGETSQVINSNYGSYYVTTDGVSEWFIS